MWTAKHRRVADRRGLRYPVDLTDAASALIAPMIPPARHGGRERSADLRDPYASLSASLGIIPLERAGTDG